MFYEPLLTFVVCPVCPSRVQDSKSSLKMDNAVIEMKELYKRGFLRASNELSPNDNWQDRGLTMLAVVQTK